MSFAEIPGGSLNPCSLARGRTQIAKSVCQPWVGGWHPTPHRARAKRLSTDSKKHGGRVILRPLRHPPAFKVCSACGERKPASAFSRKDWTKDLLSYLCLACTNQRNKRLRIAKAKQQRKAASV